MFPGGLYFIKKGSQSTENVMKNPIQPKIFHHDFSIHIYIDFLLPVVFMMSFPIGRTTLLFIIFILLNQRKKIYNPNPIYQKC